MVKYQKEMRSYVCPGNHVGKFWTSCTMTLSRGLHRRFQPTQRSCKLWILSELFTCCCGFCWRVIGVCDGPWRRRQWKSGILHHWWSVRLLRDQPLHWLDHCRAAHGRRMSHIIHVSMYYLMSNMASRINFYSYIAISLIRISDITNSK